MTDIKTPYITLQNTK